MLSGGIKDEGDCGIRVATNVGQKITFVTMWCFQSKRVGYQGLLRSLFRSYLGSGFQNGSNEQDKHCWTISDTWQSRIYKGLYVYLRKDFFEKDCLLL